MRFVYEDMVAELSIEYKRRKSIKISIELPQNVLVLAPAGMKEKNVREVIDKKAEWIIRKLKEIKELGLLKSGKDYVEGETFMHMGRKSELAIAIDNSLKKPVVEFDGKKFRIRTNTREPEKLKKAMEDWYREKTFEMLVEKVANFQRYFDQRPIDIRVKRQKSRWGSCSSEHRLNFNLKCSMAPSEVVDYIVVHEMCHMVHFNHSKEFWALVEKIIPEYRQRKDWLKKYGIAMQL